jgi:hypothetical protein
LHLLASCHHCHPHLPRGCSAWDMGRAPGIKAWRTGCEYTSLLRCICCMLVWDRLGTCASCGINSASTNCHRLSIARKHVPARGKRKSILFLWGAPRERERPFSHASERSVVGKLLELLLFAFRCWGKCNKASSSVSILSESLLCQSCSESSFEQLLYWKAFCPRNDEAEQIAKLEEEVEARPRCEIPTDRKKMSFVCRRWKWISKWIWPEFALRTELCKRSDLTLVTSKSDL